jgi:hypothetical protein
MHVTAYELLTGLHIAVSLRNWSLSSSQEIAHI